MALILSSAIAFVAFLPIACSYYLLYQIISYLKGQSVFVALQGFTGFSDAAVAIYLRHLIQGFREAKPKTKGKDEAEKGNAKDFCEISVGRTIGNGGPPEAAACRTNGVHGISRRGQGQWRGA